MDIVGGYRLVRKLGEGERAEIYLGHAGEGASTDAVRTAAVKVYRPTTSAESIDIEIEALARASSRHLLSLRDLAIAPNSIPSVVLPRLGGSLARLIEQRQSIEAGEVVTALAPIATAVLELHRVGVVHGRIQLSTVLLDPSGAPVLACFGRARMIGAFPFEGSGSSLTPAQLDGSPDAVGDVVRLAKMTRGLLERVSAPSRATTDLLGWLDETDPGADIRGYTAEVAERLFDLAPAVPLRTSARGSELSSSGIPLRTSPPEATHPLESDAAAPASRILGVHVPEWVGEVLVGSRAADFILRSRRHSRDRLKHALAPVRRKVWIVGGAGVVAVVIAFVIIPTAEGSTSANEPAVSHAPATPSPNPRPTGEQPPEKQPMEERIASDDPVIAGKALLAQRETCLSKGSVICLDGVDQKDSASMDADVALIGRVQDGDDVLPGEPLVDAELRLIQRLGDSAILGITMDNEKPASLLIVKSEAGWRIRDLILN